MSNFLFQNIASVFRAPAEVVEIIQRFDPYEQGKAQNAEKNKVEIDEARPTSSPSTTRAMWRFPTSRS